MIGRDEDEPTIHEAWCNFKYELSKLEITEKIMAACVCILNSMTRFLLKIEKVVRRWMK